MNDAARLALLERLDHTVAAIEAAGRGRLLARVRCERPELARRLDGIDCEVGAALAAGEIAHAERLLDAFEAAWHDAVALERERA